MQAARLPIVFILTTLLSYSCSVLNKKRSDEPSNASPTPQGKVEDPAAPNQTPLDPPPQTNSPKPSATPNACPYTVATLECQKACDRFATLTLDRCHEQNTGTFASSVTQEMFNIYISRDIATAVGYCLDQCGKQKANVWKCIQGSSGNACSTLSQCSESNCP